MADSRGVVIEFDFTALDGAKLLFDTMRDHLAAIDDIQFTPGLEARCLAGRELEDGVCRLFDLVKTKKTAAKAVRTLSDAFVEVFAEAAPSAVTTAFKSFVKSLKEKGVKVVIATRVDPEVLAPALADVLDENAVLCQVKPTAYGSTKTDVFGMICRDNAIRRRRTLAIVGSGFSVKEALLAGLGAVAVENDHTAWQDFSGVSDFIPALNGPAVKVVQKVMNLE